MGTALTIITKHPMTCHDSQWVGRLDSCIILHHKQIRHHHRVDTFSWYLTFLLLIVFFPCSTHIYTQVTVYDFMSIQISETMASQAVRERNPHQENLNIAAAVNGSGKCEIPPSLAALTSVICTHQNKLKPIEAKLKELL